MFFPFIVPTVSWVRTIKGENMFLYAHGIFKNIMTHKKDE